MIDFIPELPPEIVDAVNSRRFVMFVGAISLLIVPVHVFSFRPVVLVFRLYPSPA